MLHLVCKFIGGPDAIFYLGVNTQKYPVVCCIKDLIQQKYPETVKCESHEVRLFLGKKDGEWLNAAGAAAVGLDGDKCPVGCEEMTYALFTKDEKYSGGVFELKGNQVHVLVRVPQRNKRPQLEDLDTVEEHLRLTLRA